MKDLQKIGVEFTADGVADFKKSLSTVNSELSKNKAEFKLLTQQYDDNTKASQKLADKQEFLSKQYDSQKNRVAILRAELEEMEGSENANAKQLEKKRTQLTNAESAMIKYGKELDDVSQKVKKGTADIEEMGKKIGKAGEDMKAAGTTMSRNVTAPILAIGAGAMVAWKEVDTAKDGIVTATGATGDALAKLTDVFDEVYGNFPFESMQVSDAIGEINTRLGFTDEQLKNSSTEFLKFAKINGIDVKSAVALVARAMGDAGIPAEEYSGLLDDLTIASQASGIGIGNLTELLTKYGAPMRALGFTTKESIAIFSSWEKAGVNTEIAFSGMKKAIGTWSAEGKDAREEFKKTLKTIGDAPDIAKATGLAIEAFGIKAGPDLADAIQGGRFEYQDFLDILEGSQGTVEKTFQATLSPADQATVALNNMKLAGADLGEVIFASLEPAFKAISEALKDFSTWFTNLDPTTQQIIIGIGGLVAAIGPMLVIFGTLAGSLSKIIALFTSEIAVKALSAIGTGIMTAATVAWNIVCAIATGITWAFGAAIAFLTSPIGLVILAIVAIIAIIVLFGDQIKAVMEKAWGTVNDILNKIQGAFKGSFGEIFAVAIGIFQNLFNNIKTVLTGVIDLVKGVFTGNWSQAWDGIKGIVGGVFSSMVTLAKAPLNMIVGALNGLINGLNKMIAGLNSIKVNIPDWVPGLGGKSFGVNIGKIGNIPYLAKGGELLNGMAVVAEAGPELLMQQGNKTKVLPLTNGGGATPTEIIDYQKLGYEVAKAIKGMVVEMDGRELGKVIDKRLVKAVY
jgi:TP901 family phage tail tape measure protein